MISPEEISTQSEKWYRDFLISCLEGNDFFPRSVRFGKVIAADLDKNFPAVNDAINKLNQFSRNGTRGYGYCIEYQEINTRGYGRNLFPTNIFFPSQIDYLKFHKKEKEFSEFQSDTELILRTNSRLKPWILSDPFKVISHHGKWNSILEVCKYFIHNPKPGIYLRELPLKLHTKFIEQNQAVISSLLDFLVPESINEDERIFEKRYNLKYNESLVRLKILDERISKNYFSGIQDLSLPISEFNKLSIECERIIMFENKTNFSNVYNFLSLPNLKNSVAIFGKGFAIGLLKENKWLKEKKIFYWGDIDAHGFMILSRLRSYFPCVKSIFMDKVTFKNFIGFAVKGIETQQCELTFLTEEENDLYRYLFSIENNRLEQEKIPNWYVLEKLETELS